MTEEETPTQPTSSPPADEEPNDTDIVKDPIIDNEVNPIEEAKAMLEENKKLLIAMSDERKKIEKATAEMLINGRSYAGQQPKPPETADEKWAREAKVRYAGTGMDPTE